MNALDTAVLQVIKLHAAFMQLVRTEIILALNICILIASTLLSGPEDRDVQSNSLRKL
jgi:uncharacterized membrane protein affecting hemolysin expression